MSLFNGLGVSNLLSGMEINFNGPLVAFGSLY